MNIRRHYTLFTFLLLVLIIEAKGSKINETSQDRRQSRVTGRIVKLYSGTRPEPILCAGEGFHADPHDCAVFYRCLKSGSGKYTVFRFQCGPGTVYDPETEVCNHPRSTKRSECGGLSPPPVIDRINSNEIKGTQNEIPSPITNKLEFTSSPVPTETKTRAKATFTTVKPWIASSSTFITSTKRQVPDVSTIFSKPYPWGSSFGHSSDTTVNPMYSHQYTATQTKQRTELPRTFPPRLSNTNPRDNICMSDGFMGDNENCRKFYRCVADQRGTYTRYEFSCSETTIWDDDTQSCNHAWAVKRGRCGRSNQNSLNTLFTNENAEKPEKASKEQTIQQQLQVSYDSKVTQTQTQISNGSVIQNQTQINFGDRINKNKGSVAKQNQTQISLGSAVSQTQTQIDYSDKGVQTQLQIDHSQQASQTQIQVHESTTSGNPPSSSSTHVDTQNSNKCDKSGFMGDPNECKKFYRCIDNGRGGYTRFEFSCGEGTVWDQSIEACNHAWAVKECVGNGPSETTSTTQAASTSTQSYYTTVSTENYHTTSELIATEDNEDNGYGQQNQDPTSTTTKTSSSTTMSPSTTKSPSYGGCQSSGFIGDSNNCKVFYRCVENGRGSFTKYEFKCGEGTVWDPDLEACNHAWAVKKCGGNSSPGINNEDKTTEKQTTFSTSHTQSAIITQTTELAPIQNDDYDTGYGSANNEVTLTTTTTTKTPQNIDHSTSNNCHSSGFMGDENDCKKFYRCVDSGNGRYTRYEFTCGEGTVWDSQIEACNHAWAVEKCGGSSDHQEATTQSRPTTNYETVGSSSTESVQNTVSTTLFSTTTLSTSIITESMSATSNDCRNSGFMGDKKDCKKFYRCVDNGKGSFTKYEFSCGEGTVWDQNIEACNHVWAVEKCGGTMESSSGHPESTTQYHPTMSDEIDNGYPSNVDTSSQSTTAHPTTEGLKEPSEGSNCISSGFIGDKNDCKKFYRCVDDGKGGFIRYEFSCGEGTLWDQSIEACNHAWAVTDCGKTGNNTTQTPSQITTQASLTSVTEDQVYPQFTEKPSTSTVSNYPAITTTDKCSTEGFIGDDKNCKKFYRCVDNGRGGFTKHEFTCGEGTYWNQEILACDHATSDKTCGGKESGSSTQFPQYDHDEIYTEATSMSSSSTVSYENEYPTQKPQTSSRACTSEGFYGDENDCKKFYRCVDNGKGSYTKYDFTCGDGTVWDQEIQTCNHETSNKKCSSNVPPTISETTEHRPEDTNDISMTTAQTQHSTEKTETSSTSSSSQCSSEGFFADPNDCKKFIRCVSNDKGGYTKYEFSCGDGTIWVQDILACDHDTGETDCSSQTTTKPLTTVGQTQTTEKYESATSTSEPQTIDKQEDEYDSGKQPSQAGSGSCSSEGFYANENDCRQFYRCVDNGKGGFTKYDFTCGEGTAWDSDIQTCNHINQVQNCHDSNEPHPIMHDEDNNQPIEISSTMKTTTSGFSTTPGSSVTSGNNTCDSEGYFGDTQDCKKFYRCVDNGKGGYTKYDYTCGEGTIWDQDVNTCNHPQDVTHPSCNQNHSGSSSTTSSQDSTTQKSSTSQSSTEPTSQSTTTSSSSSDISSSSQTTTEKSNCSQTETSKKPNQNITCDEAGYFPNPNDCKKFYRCVDWDGDGKRFSVYHFDCGEGTIWDPAVETCNHEESVYPPRDCSGSQSQSENQPPATEGTTTTQKSSTSQSSTEQATQSTSSDPPTTQQSTTSDQTTTQQSTNSEPTTTQRSTTSEQTTQQTSASEQTTTQKSTTSEQTTQQSTTSEQTTQQSTTSEQTTQQPITSEQTTQQSTTSEQTTQQPSYTEQTTTQQSTTSEQTTIQQSTSSEQTTTQQTTTSEQTTTEQSTTGQQTTQETTSEQTTQASTTEQSTNNETTTEQSSPTEQSTTQQSTTTEQSQQSTTEGSTSSEGTTTGESTTEHSTTEQTNENSTIESNTEENSSDKKCPETNENQNLFVCPTSFMRHPKYCNLFYQCDEDDDTHDLKIAVFTCPNNTIYDENQTRCVEESKADKKCDGKIAQKRRFKRLDKDYKEPIVVTKDSHACLSAGYFSFETNSECSPAFLKCKTDKTKKLRGLVYRCPIGYVYWSISKRCEPIDKVRGCKRSHNNWTERWEIPVERRNVAPS